MRHPSPLTRQTSCSSRLTWQASFTLVELLVVIAILSVLAALLLPALKNARDRAKRLTCVNCQRQTAVALNTYRSDYNDYYPVASGDSMSPCTDPPCGTTFQPLLAKHMGTSNTIYGKVACETYYSWGSGPNDPKVRKIVGNQFLMGASRYQDPTTGNIYAMPFYHASEVTHPSKVFTIACGCPTLYTTIDINAFEQTCRNVGYASTQFTAPFKGAGINMAFVDGHVDWCPNYPGSGSLPLGLRNDDSQCSRWWWYTPLLSWMQAPYNRQCEIFGP